MANKPRNRRIYQRNMLGTGQTSVVYEPEGKLRARGCTSPTADPKDVRRLTMKKIGSVVVHGLLIIGMVYALISIVPLPAYACTPSQCSSIEQNVGFICEGFNPNCTQGGEVNSCSSSGFAITCFGCGVFRTGQCN